MEQAERNSRQGVRYHDTRLALEVMDPTDHDPGAERTARPSAR